MCVTPGFIYGIFWFSMYDIFGGILFRVGFIYGSFWLSKSYVIDYFNEMYNVTARFS